MKSILALALTLASSAAFANWGGGNERSNGPTNTHIYSRGMSCAAVQNAVMANGAVILHYGDGLYDRVVSSQAYCSSASGEVAEAYWAPSADDAQCFAGYYCANRNGGGN